MKCLHRYANYSLGRWGHSFAGKDLSHSMFMDERIGDECRRLGPLQLFAPKRTGHVAHRHKLSIDNLCSKTLYTCHFTTVMCGVCMGNHMGLAMFHKHGFSIPYIGNEQLAARLLERDHGSDS